MKYLHDDSTHTCSVFVAVHHGHTQIFDQAVCATDQVSVTLVGKEMNCLQDIYLAGLTGSDVEKARNRWRACHTTTDNGVDWCSFHCQCSGRCEQVMVLRWPQTPAHSSWTLCDIYQHCNGKAYTSCSLFSFSLLTTLQAF